MTWFDTGGNTPPFEPVVSPSEHSEKNNANRRPRPDCTAYRCMCKWLRFHANRENSKLRKGGAGG